MLVLTRKSNQSIMIGDDIEITVLSVMGEKVRIGIQAPREIPVFRQEVYVEIQQERGQDPPPEAVTAPRGHGAANGANGAGDARAAVDAARRRLDAD
ncbi:MAG: carbon storage regulator CsrA [Actinomycetota bacterium]|nr:carbon storage regulator CsrA [Solirubrobacterales bacterium]MDQ3409355.1 carbon storage regulator CsrA [Actinomycetota bacterium]